MILNRSKKIGIFLNPKTGTTTLCHVLSDGADVIEHIHENLIEAELKFGELSSYKLYCFYRDPVERAKSIIKAYPILPNNLNYLDMLFQEPLQSHWLNFSNITILDFKRLDIEIMKFCDLLEVKLHSIPTLNQSKNLNAEREIFINENIEAVKQYFSRDYIFESKLSQII